MVQAPPPHDDIRRAILVALFSDDVLFDQLVLKGGNALRLVYQLQNRTSLDLDFSLETEFDDLEDTQRRLKRVLGDRLDSAGYFVFDEKLVPRPAVGGTETWGGYRLTFKILSKRDHSRLVGSSIENWRNQAVSVDAQQHRTWTVDFSKHEYCAGKISFELDSQTIYVYSPEMIAIEKLRALCQQMPAYTRRAHPAPRARDFHDIYTVITRLSLQLDTQGDLARAIFQAKDVPLFLLREIRGTRDFHAGDWANVQVSATADLGSFDQYFDYVANLAERLEPLWNVQPPTRGVNGAP